MLVIEDVLEAIKSGRCPLILTEIKEHVAFFSKNGSSVVVIIFFIYLYNVATDLSTLSRIVHYGHFCIAS